MPYITSIERIGREKGMQQGMQQGMQLGMQEEAGSLLRRLLTRRFGALTAETAARIEAASRDQLECWLDNILDAERLEDVFNAH